MGVWVLDTLEAIDAAHLALYRGSRRGKGAENARKTYV
jgi:hypothetical protein